MTAFDQVSNPQAAIASFAQDCRRAYQPQPVVTVLPPAVYDAVEQAVADGTATAWMAADFRAGRYARAERFVIDEEC